MYPLRDDFAIMLFFMHVSVLCYCTINKCVQENITDEAVIILSAFLHLSGCLKAFIHIYMHASAVEIFVQCKYQLVEYSFLSTYYVVPHSQINIILTS